MSTMMTTPTGEPTVRYTFDRKLKPNAIKAFFATIYRNKKAFVGMIILLFFLCMAVFGPMVIHLNMTVQYNERYQGPSLHHLLGTDYAGRDTFGQVVYGSRDVLLIGFFASLFTIIIGVIVGTVSGLIGGKFDTILMFITNLFLTIPSFPAMMIIAALFSITNPILFAVILSAWQWAGLARAVRSQIFSLKQREFIKVCRVMGLGTGYIISREIMPNIASYISISFIQTIQGSIVASVGLMLLGLAPFSITNWGTMLNLAIQNTGGIFNPRGYYYLLAPIVCLSLFQMGSIFFSNGIDDAMNPRLRTNS